MSDQLPTAWSKARLGNLCTIKTGKRDVNEGKCDGAYPFFTCAQKIYRIDSCPFDGESILVAGNGFFNVKYYNGKFDAYQRTYVLQNFAVDGKFLYRYIQFRLDDITKDNRGSTINYIRLGDLTDHVVSVAPLNEQRRIVAKLEKLLGKVDGCQQRLVKIPVLLKRFRQSVLAAGCSGQLTADWREKNPNSQEWKTIGLVELSKRIQIGPFGTQLHKADYVSNGVPLINPTHIQSSKIVHDPDFTVSKTKLRELENYVLQENDIIMGRRGEMARCALVSENESGWLCGTGSLFVRPKSTVCPAFLFLVLRSPETKAFLEAESKGTTMSNLNLEILKNVPVSISSLPEQQEIVRRVESLFALADQIEARYAKAKAHVEKLTQSILARAFRGELVLQDPNDEPAEALLSRIHQQRKDGKKA